MGFKSKNAIALVVVAGLMAFTASYLTQHFFEIKFPEGLSGSSVCNINEFLNCDKATNSPLAAPFNIPTSIFGGLIGLFILAGVVIKNENYHRTLFSVLILNFTGCLLLLGYSIFVLNSICIFCSLYYLLSGAALFLYWQKGLKPGLDLRVLGICFLVVASVSLGMRQIVLNKITEVENADAILKAAVLNEFKALPKVNFVGSPAEFKINTVGNAPVKMIIFSDFECPACRVLSEQIPRILEGYKTRIDISYYFYPLDQACNKNVNREMHLHACKAAAAAICLPQLNFFELHDFFFKNQSGFAQGFIEQFIGENKIEACVSSSSTQSRLKEIIELASPVQIKSTPTFLLNGVKFEGAVPFYKLKIILDHLLLN